MDNKTRIEILEDWLANPAHMGKIPPGMESRVSGKDIERISLEMGKYGSPELAKGNIILYLTELEGELFKEETLRIQKDVKTTQLIIAGVMAFTFLAALGSAVITWLNYQAQLDINSPLFELNLNCSPISSEEGAISIQSKVTNHGKIGAKVYGSVYVEGNVRLENLVVDDIPQNFTKENIDLANRFVEGGAVQKFLNYRMNLKDAESEFKVIHTFNCKDIDKRYQCKFVENSFSCDYYSNGTHYLLKQQSVL